MNRSNGTWVYNMRKTFEDVCVNFDEYVCKEPVAFVGNQMETVSENMKNFFSGFVDDFVLTRVVDPVQHVARLIPSKCINLLESSTSSVIEVKENTVDSKTNKPNEAPLVPKELGHKPSSPGVCHSEQSTSSNTKNPNEAPLVPKELCHELSSTGLCHTEQSTSEISGDLIGETDSLINMTADGTTQVNLKSSTSSQNLDNRSEEDGVIYDESVFGDGTAFEYSDWGIEHIMDLNLDTDNTIKEDPSLSLEEKKMLLNSTVDEPECDLYSSTTHESSELVGAFTCNENKEENAGHIIAGGLSSENLYESLNSPFRSSIVEPVTFKCNPHGTVDFSSVSSDIISSCGSFTTLSYESNNEAYESWSGIGLACGSTVDFEDVYTDTVERPVTSAIVESGKHSAFANTLRSKSYKKMIQDAFMSRKRLTKEYKQLAIWYGDIEKELCKPKELNSKQPVQDLPDSEWELL